jgi:hypothetical protein
MMSSIDIESLGSPRSMTSLLDLDSEGEVDDLLSQRFDSPQEHSFSKLSPASLALFDLAHLKSNMKVTVKSLISEFSIPMEDIKTYLDIKKILCQGTGMQSSDILLISKGKEMLNDNIVSHKISNVKYHTLLRTKACSTISLICKYNGKANKIIFPANTKVFHVKRELFGKKLTTLRPGSQRLIIAGRQLHDNMLLGDYLLQSNASKKKMLTSDGEIILHISKSFNADHEVDVMTSLNNGAKLKFSMSISSPTMYMREIIWRQYHMPMPTEILTYLIVKGRPVELHPDYTLIDYGVTSETKSVEIVMAKLTIDLPDSLSGLNILPHVAPSPAQAFLNADHPIIQLAAPIVKSENEGASIKPSLSMTKKRPNEKEKEGTAIFKGMKKGFFDSKPSMKSKSQRPMNNNSFSGIKKGFLLTSSPSKELSSPEKSSKETQITEG